MADANRVVKLITNVDVGHQSAVDSVVRQLEQWLEKARAGEIEGIAVAALYSDGACGCGFSETTSYFRLLGAVTDLQMTYFAQHNQGRQ